VKTLPPGLVEGQTVEGALEVGCDVCVVGSGAGGAVTAWTLAQAGLSVVILEEGGCFTKERFHQREDEAYPFLYQDAGGRTTSDGAIAILQGKCVGGGTTVNWTTCFRTPDDVVDLWHTRHAVNEVSVATLRPAFEWIEKRLSIAPVPLALVNANNRTLWDGCTKLGFGVSTTQRNVLGCAQTGSCGHGCPIDAKQSALVTLLPDAMKAGATLVSRCKVERVVFDGARAVAVEAGFHDAFGLAPTGARLTVRPRAVVVAGGAINSPALLLRSGCPNENGRLGRRTFLHPVVGATGVHDARIEGWKGAPQSVASHHFAHRGDEVGFFLEVAPIHPLLAGTAVPGFGPAHHEVMAKLPHLSAPIALTIDGHHDDVEGGRLVLRPSGAPALEYPIVDRQWRAFREALKVMARVAFAAGAHTVLTGHEPALVLKSEGGLDAIDRAIDAAPWRPGSVALFSAHQMGGCAMSDDRARGVVRSVDLRHHAVENLHVIDGSVFPTSLGVNPQVSIFALARLAASRMVDAWRRR
jgi:choline dehydrogenase-like flavoprotein